MCVCTAFAALGHRTKKLTVTLKPNYVSFRSMNVSSPFPNDTGIILQGEMVVCYFAQNSLSLFLCLHEVQWDFVVVCFISRASLWIKWPRFFTTLKGFQNLFVKWESKPYTRAVVRETHFEALAWMSCGWRYEMPHDRLMTCAGCMRTVMESCCHVCGI